jgi:hypothetical protein
MKPTTVPARQLRTRGEDLLQSRCRSGSMITVRIGGRARTHVFRAARRSHFDEGQWRSLSQLTCIFS